VKFKHQLREGKKLEAVRVEMPVAEAEQFAIRLARAAVEAAEAHGPTATVVIDLVTGSPPGVINKGGA
jgi:hypothetical protein